jgi:hypothetical protein
MDTNRVRRGAGGSAQRVQYLMKIGVAGVLMLVVVPLRAEEGRRGRQRTWREKKE